MKTTHCNWTLLGVFFLWIVLLNVCVNEALVVPQPRSSEIESNSIDGKADDQKGQSGETTSKPDIEYGEDDDDDDEDYEYSDKTQSQDIADKPKLPSFSSTTEKHKLLKICVSLSPAHASTRNGPFVSYECSARICSNGDDEGDSIDEESYKFRRPIFDWNSQFSHLLLSNGTCDSSALNCWHKIDINVDSLTDAIEEDGIDQLEIKCNVADYVNSYDVFNYVFGEATSVLRHFRGNRAHESCNITEDCGENLICTQNEDNSILTENSSTGFCECPSEQLMLVSSDGDVTTSAMRSFILVEDPHYLEQMCVPVQSFNESCLYDSQCKAADWNLFCKQVVRDDGVASSEMVCDCVGGLRWGSTDGMAMKCLNTASGDTQEVDQLMEDDAAVSAPLETQNTSSQETSTSGNRVYIWWIFPPSESTDSDMESSRSSHGLYYYGSRYVTLTNFAYFLASMAIMLPAILLAVTLIFYCQRKLIQSRQYQPRRTSFTDSIYSDVMPSTPSEKSKSVTFGFGLITPPSSPTGKTFEKISRSKKADDKLDLVDNDQLEQGH